MPIVAGYAPDIWEETDEARSQDRSRCHDRLGQRPQRMRQWWRRCLLWCLRQGQPVHLRPRLLPRLRTRRPL